MKAARIIEPDKPLELNQVEISDPSGTQVLIKVSQLESVTVIFIFGKVDMILVMDS